MPDSPATYRFGPLERRGLLGPIRAGQAGLVLVGAAVAILILDRAPNAGGAFGGMLALGLAIALATAPVGGRTMSDWAPAVLAFTGRAVTGRLSFRSPVPRLGTAWSTSGARQTRRSRGRPPHSLAGVEVVAVEHRGRTVGALAEPARRRLTAVLACRVVSFALLDPEAQGRRLARWGTLLSGTADGPIRRIQWIERTAPAQADALARWLHEARDPAVPLRGAPIVESYLELIGTSSQTSHDHEILVAVQVEAGRLRDRRPQTLGSTLLEQCERVAGALEAGEVSVLGALTTGQLNRALRTAFDPYAGAELAALQMADGDRDGVDEVNAWPLATDERWDHLRSDGALHATYWIGGWPRVEVSPMFMEALLASSDAVRAVAVTFEPVPAAQSTREIEAAVTRDRADSELRRRFGQGETARQRQAQEAARRRESELAAGHGEIRMAGFVTVSGRDEQDLRRACHVVLEHAASARLELHRLYGQQAEAFAFTLPLARGLR